jgi:hypothetical protein
MRRGVAICGARLPAPHQPESRTPEIQEKFGRETPRAETLTYGRRHFASGNPLPALAPVSRGRKSCPLSSSTLGEREKGRRKGLRLRFLGGRTKWRARGAS